MYSHTLHITCPYTSSSSSSSNQPTSTVSCGSVVTLDLVCHVCLPEVVDKGKQLLLKAFLEEHSSQVCSVYGVN